MTIDGAKVVGAHWVGAIAGYVQSGSIINCVVKNAIVKSVYFDNEYDGDKAGAVAGYLNHGVVVTVKNCKAIDCEISAAKEAGQVVGCAKAPTVVENCTAENVSVTADSTNVPEGFNHKNIKEDIVGRTE